MRQQRRAAPRRRAAIPERIDRRRRRGGADRRRDAAARRAADRRRSQRIAVQRRRTADGPQRAGAAEQRRAPRIRARPDAGLLEPEFVGPGDQRAEQQLVVDQDHDQHGQDGIADRARRSCCSIASGDIGADAGQGDVVSPTVIASEATTKNQPPDIDIIMFQTSPGMAKGTSSRQKRCQRLRWKLRRPRPDPSARCAATGRS